jgi:hypothetical protein
VDRFSSQINAAKKMVVDDIDGHPITCHGESLICCSESIPMKIGFVIPRDSYKSIKIPHENGFIDVHVTLP